MADPRLILAALLAVLICSGGAGWQGYRLGYAAAGADHNAQLLAEIEAGAKLEEERRSLAAERDALARQLEEESHADPVFVERCLAPDRVRRLNTLR